MPTGTYLRLPEGKRSRIRAAIRHEFEREDFENISINRIINEAGIPRGSFYQYFTDKKDMLDTVICEFRELVAELAEKAFEKNGGDIFASATDLFGYFIDYSRELQHREICRKMLLNMRIKDALTVGIKNSRGCADFTDIAVKLAKGLGDIGDEQKKRIAELVAMVVKGSLSEIFCDEYDKPTLMARLCDRLDIIKKGIGVG